MNDFPRYDLMLLLDRRLEAEGRTAILDGIKSRIEGSGSLVGAHDWGMRSTAFDIGHEPEAEYHLIQFSGSPQLLADLEHTLKITDGVSRFRLFKLPRNAAEPPAPPTPVTIEPDGEDD